jgi:hypothetical protein
MRDAAFREIESRLNRIRFGAIGSPRRSDGRACSGRPAERASDVVGLRRLQLDDNDADDPIGPSERLEAGGFQRWHSCVARSGAMHMLRAGV